MLLHRCLEKVFGNKTSIALLRTMIDYRGKIFTIRGLADEAGISPNETALVVHDLEKIGVMKIQPIGRAYHLELNEKSYIVSEIIKPVIKAEKNTMNQLIQILRKYFNTKKIISAAVFGSVAEGKEKLDSDLDLLVISDDRDHAISQISSAGEDMLFRFHVRLSPLIFTEKEFKDKQKGSLTQSIINNHILICGKKIKDR